ncbi:hypothetical protein LTR02_004090 [Friedmanniomyces endolithicus]|nr:hypothetical protein LTR94_005611 [Friedmanniomyces endolithicus]KAK0770579.1 hypothetical protein LTR59_016447 [Friedmanniomyces endolithicus]KAK0787986.1 hypothetical protein LTR75_012740 [Friedmanniomyces endolithicus]KAK0816904.1 hypothetical protein LTR38_001934 [Friedmanniomyces endolithicus]KAK0845570.1 hypothetical protein LTS02_015244 [Friedmanniomyces endolithicus]
MVEPLPPLPSITRLSPLVLRILGGNPSKFTLQGTNTYLIGAGPRKILLDTGEGNDIWPQTLKEALESETASGDEAVSIETVLLSHWHPDHIGGVPDVLALFPHAKVYKNYSTHTEAEQEDIVDGQTFRVPGATLRALHTPGHAADHMAFLLEEEDAMFTGDNVLGHGTAVFEDLAGYIGSLERMAGTGFKGRAYPGHGEVVEEGRGKVGEYVRHRRGREEEVMGGLRGEEGVGGGDAGWSSMGIVKVVYKAYPEGLHGPAEGGVVQVLRKLEGEGRVERVGGSGWRIAGAESQKKSAL